MNRTGLLTLLVLLFSVEFIVLAIAPHDRADWALENALVLVAALTLIFSYKHLPLSNISYTLIFLFLCLHEVGAHYTYAEVPYNQWWQALTGSTFNEVMGWERNREVFLRVADVRGFWGYFLPLDLTMSTSMIFELFEWGAAELFGGDLGIAYLGTQGDVWDAHKDMALASLGAILAMGVTMSINGALQRDFALEWAESLRVKRSEPLGERAIANLLKEKS